MNREEFGAAITELKVRVNLFERDKRGEFERRSRRTRDFASDEPRA